uniref:Uncharacterized protein n=1 Tax=Chenopodium quinoa TaxID=63459 RepID=A0A803LPM7_CHEQI
MALSDNLDLVKTQPKIDDLETKFLRTLNFCPDVKCYTNYDLDDEFVYPYNLPTVEELFESMVNVDSSVDDDAASLKNKEEIEEKKMVGHGSYKDSCTDESKKAKNDEDCYAPLKNKEEQKSMTEADGAVVGVPPMNRVHISKRALRNKSLSVTFNEKDLRDYVGGFHKRKKKRRKEALKQQGEAERRKRLEDRKKRRKEKEYALYGGAPPEDGAKSVDEDLEQNDQIELNPLASDFDTFALSSLVEGTTSYENGDIMVTVTTSEIGHEENPTEKSASLIPQSGSTGEAVKKQNIPVSKKKAFKKSTKGRSRTKLVSKRERRKGKINGKKKR